MSGLMRRRNARLLIIDPAPTLLDKDHSSNNDANVRQSFSDLSTACHEMDCALVLVRHTNKRTLGDAMDRGGGSIGWTGMARVELMLGRRPVEEGTTVTDTHESVVTLAIVKCNNGRWAPSLNLAIVEDGESARIEVVGETEATADDLCAMAKPHVALKMGEAEETIRHFERRSVAPAARNHGRHRRKENQREDHQARQEGAERGQRTAARWMVVAAARGPGGCGSYPVSPLTL